MIRFSRVIFLLFILVIALTLISVEKINAAENFTENNKYQVVNDRDVILFRISESRPESPDDQRKQAFSFIRPYLTKKINRASVLWQENDYSYGLMVSVTNLDIADFLDNKLNLDAFINSFQLRPVEPVKFNRNNIEKINITPVYDSKILEASNLREKADIYRLNDKIDSAERIYLQVLDINPNDSISMFRLGEIYKIRGKFDIAKSYFKKALSIDPGFISADEALFILNNSSNNNQVNF